MADNSKAAIIPLTDEGKLRLVYLLLIHQKPINYDNFDPGTGHSIRAIQGIIERIGQKVATDPTPNKSVTPAAKPTPKKRGRPAKNAEVADEASPSKKGRKAVAKKVEAGDEDDCAAEIADKGPPAKKGRKAAAKKETKAEVEDESKLIKKEQDAMEEEKQDSAVGGETETVAAEAEEA